MKFLFVDDDRAWLAAMRRVFSSNQRVILAECHSVKDALHAVACHQPDVIFLDHSLTEGGAEGFEIVKQLKGVKIYSTTANSNVRSWYADRGIEHVGKTDVKQFRSVIAGQTPVSVKETQTMQEVTQQEACDLIDRIGPHLGCGDYTSGTVFPEGRKDVCAVRRMAENGSDYGFDTIYLVWKEPDGTLRHREIRNSRDTKDYIHVQSVEVKPDGGVSVKFGSGGSYSGVPWSESMKVAIVSGQVEVSKEAPATFAEKVKQVMLEVVQSHIHQHPLYQPTHVTLSVVDENRNVAIFILFEQIDTDRCTKDGEGYLGDQFRYSLWKVSGTGKAVQLYEDHAYIRPYSKNGMTGTRGRDCSLTNPRIDGDVIRVVHKKGDKVEEQIPEELTFNL